MSGLDPLRSFPPGSDNRRMETLAFDRVERDFRELEGRAMDSHTVRHEVLARLRRAVPVDAYCFAEVDPGSQMMVAHATERIDRKLSSRLYVNEYMERDFLKHRSLIDGPRRARVLSDAARGELQRSPRFRKVLAPMGVGHELRAACVEDGQAWGLLHLYRVSHRSDFTAAEAAVIARASGLLARLIRSAVLTPGFASVCASLAPTTGWRRRPARPACAWRTCKIPRRAKSRRRRRSSRPWPFAPGRSQRLRQRR